MKKMICLLVIVLMIASVAFAAKKMMITPKDLAGLKGTWEGMLDFGVMGGTSASAPCKLELLNDAVPVKMKLTLLNVPDFVAQQLGITGGTNVVENNDGVITSQGTVMWTGAEKNFFEISLSGEKKLSANYYFRTVKGYASLKKK